MIKVMLTNSNIPIERFSEDTKSNNYGYNLIQLCKNFDIHLCNGRLDKDCKIGKVTC